MSDPQPLPFVDGVYCGAVWQWTRTSTGTWMRRASSQEDWRAVESGRAIRIRTGHFLPHTVSGCGSLIESLPKFTVPGHAGRVDLQEWRLKAVEVLDPFAMLLDRSLVPVEFVGGTLECVHDQLSSLSAAFHVGHRQYT